MHFVGAAIFLISFVLKIDQEKTFQIISHQQFRFVGSEDKALRIDERRPGEQRFNLILVWPDYVDRRGETVARINVAVCIEREIA